jgi:prepilin-type N-terminal cleavage/methylation domain-containing protein
MKHKQAAFTLVELLTAVAITAIATSLLTSLISGGARGAARTAQQETAILLGNRTMDNIVGLGFETLSRKAGGVSGVDLRAFLDPADVPSVPGGPLVIDSTAYAAHLEISAIAGGLMRLRLTLEWASASTAKGVATRLMISRFVADPRAALTFR